MYKDNYVISPGLQYSIVFTISDCEMEEFCNILLKEYHNKCDTIQEIQFAPHMGNGAAHICLKYFVGNSYFMARAPHVAGHFEELNLYLFGCEIKNLKGEMKFNKKITKLWMRFLLEKYPTYRPMYEKYKLRYLKNVERENRIRTEEANDLFSDTI